MQSLYFCVRSSRNISFVSLSVNSYLENVPIITLVRFEPAESVKLCTVQKKDIATNKSSFSLTNKNISVKIAALLCFLQRSDPLSPSLRRLVTHLDEMKCVHVSDVHAAQMINTNRCFFKSLFVKH